jgi:protein-tyrosine phosphatase
MDSVSDSDRALLVDGLVNARDLGGLRRADGGRTPRGVLFRSENIDWITGDGWQQLHDAGIRTVVDLRQPGERDLDGSRRPEWLTTIAVDLDGLDNAVFWADYWESGKVGTALYFLPHLRAMPERAGAALAAIVTAPPGGVLFHCMAGRDRTGMIAMILLAAVGVVEDDIVDDYLETVRLGEVRAANSGRENAEPKLEELCRLHGTTTEGAFRSALAGLDLAGILRSAGVTDPAREALMTWRGTV